MTRLTALVFVLCLIPGVVSWLSGFRVIRLRDDPMLPERLQERNVLVGWVTIAALIPALVLPVSGVWRIPLVAVSLIVGNFPVRRDVFGDRWGLGTYVAYYVRLVVATAGFWLLLAYAPFLILSAGPWRSVVAGAFFTVLLAGSTFYSSIFAWLLFGQPLSSSTLFDQITQRSRARPPHLVRLAVPRGNIINAVALPSLRRPIVAFTSTLLDLLTPEEQAAIYAHEVAHLEEATPARLWRAELRDVFGISLGTIAPAVHLPGFEIVLLAWPILLLGYFIYILARSRGREERSDRRAVELCGDAEALVRALTKITAHARMPRRWDVGVEREATHPSLTRRIQAIRGFVTPAAKMPSVGFPLRPPCRFVVFASDRISWLEGVTPGTSMDPDALRANASTAHQVLYADLLELRVKMSILSGPRLVLTDKTGRVQTLPIRDADVPSIQDALDRADLHLASLPPPLRFELFIVRGILAGCLYLAGRVALTATAVFPSLAVATIFAVPTALAMLAASAAGQAIAVLWNFPYEFPRQPLIGLALSILTVVATWETRRLAHKAVYRNKVFTVTLPLVGGVLIMLVTWVSTYLRFADLNNTARQFDAPAVLTRMLLQDVILDHPEVWITPLSVAAGLWVQRNRWAKVAASTFLIAGLVLFAFSKRAVRLF